MFDVAVGERAISHMGHIKMMGAVQPFLSGAISKTVNLPQTASVEDIADAYIEAWRCGVKALAIYRDGSKTAQALRTDAQQGVEHRRASPRPWPRRSRACTPRSSSTPRSQGGHHGQGRGRPGAQAHAGRAPVDHPQVLDRRPRGLHHGGRLRRRQRRRDLPHRRRQGGLDAPRHDELVRDGDLDRAAVRRAARDAGAEVQLHALRPGGDHPEPGDPVRQVDARLHHALAGLALPGRRHPGGARHPHARGPRPQDGRGRGDVDGLGHRRPVERRQRRREHAPAPAPRAQTPAAAAGTPGTPTVAGSQPATTRAAAEALTDTPPVVPARLPAWTSARRATSAAA